MAKLNINMTVPDFDPDYPETAHEGVEDAAYALKRVTLKLREGYVDGVVFGINGHTIGWWSLEDD